MHYQTYSPAEDLKDFVICYWTLEDESDEIQKRQTIVPDGCFEMIFHYGDLYKQYINSKDYILQPKAFVIGQLTKPLEIEPTGRTGIFSIRFRPEGFLPFVSVDLKVFENTAISLNSIFGDSEIELFRKVLYVNTTNERIGLIECFLKEQLKDSKSIDRIVTATVELMTRTKGNVHLGDHSHQSLINRRKLERRFIAGIGLSPKKLARIIRLQTALRKLLSDDGSDLTNIAYDTNFYDQSHFIKDFKEFAGVSPKKFFGPSFKFSELFYEKL